MLLKIDLKDGDPCTCYNYPTVSCQQGSHAFLCHVLLDISEKKNSIYTS